MSCALCGWTSSLSVRYLSFQMSLSRCWKYSWWGLLVEFLSKNCPWLGETASPRLNPLTWVACIHWVIWVCKNPCLKVGQCRRAVLASDLLPVGSPEAFVEAALQPKFSLLFPPLLCALPHAPPACQLVSDSVPGEPDLSQLGIVLRAFHALSL